MAKKKKKDNVTSDALRTEESTLDVFALTEPDSYEDDDTKLEYKAFVILENADADRIEKIAEDIRLEAFPDIPREQMDGWPVKVGDDAFFSRKEKPEKYEHLRGKRWIAPTRKAELGTPNLYYYDFAAAEKVELPLDSEENIKIATNKFYRGCKVYAGFIVSSYIFAGKKGVTCYLNSVLFVRDGERISSAGTEYDDIKPEPDMSGVEGVEVDPEVGANI